MRYLQGLLTISGPISLLFQTMACQNCRISISSPLGVCRKCQRAKALWFPITRPVHCSNITLRRSRRRQRRPKSFWPDQGKSKQIHLCTSGKFRPGPHVPDGPALPSWRQRPERSGQGLGQDLGLSQGTAQEYRILSCRHRRSDEKSSAKARAI